MKYKISKERFNEISKKLVIYFFGEIYFFNHGFKTKDFNTAVERKKKKAKGVEHVEYVEVFNSEGRNIIDIWIGGNMRGKRCKSLTNIHVEVLEPIEKFLPIMRKKEFGKVLSEYFQEQLNYKADCIDFHYSHEEKYDDEGDTEEYEFKTYKYRPNKNKKR